jgi:nucleotide-binding universal stress UspA family protein
VGEPIIGSTGRFSVAKEAGQTEQGTVVVGIDGSESSTSALEWAASYAEATGTKVHAVAVWRDSGAMSFDVGGGAWDREGACRKRAKHQVALVAPAHPGLEIELDVVRGDAREALVDASKDATLLVVGTRGHGGFANLMLGSTSTHCVHEAHCTVVVCR